jgi:hypothetical protein
MFPIQDLKLYQAGKKLVAQEKLKQAQLQNDEAEACLRT